MTDMSSDGCARIYVGGLNESIKKEDLQTQFEKFGKLNKVWVAFNPPGFAFIEYFNMDEAEMACNNMNGTEIMGAKLRVEISRGKRGTRGGFRGQGRRPFGSRGGGEAGGGYDQGGGSYYSGRAGGNSGPYGQGYGNAGGYAYQNNYSQDGYDGGASQNYYGGKDSSSKYRSRSPPGRSQRHLRQCI